MPIAAISSLGTLRAADKLSLLKALYADERILWQERAMALKSIGDLGTAEADAYLRSEQKRLAMVPGVESVWLIQVIGLYL